MTRKLRLLALVGAATILSACATAGDLIGIRVNLGYHWSQNFDLRNGGRGSMDGPDVGIDFPLMKVALIQLYASPSVVFGGKVSGGDIEGHFYRFMVSARQNLTPEGLYGAVAAGVAHSQSKGSTEFRSESGFVGSLAIGMPLKFKVFGANPSLEGKYYFSSEEQFRGITLGLSVNF